MEHELASRHLMPTNRNNNPPSPNGASSDANCLFTSIHYQEWVRILKKSCRKRETVFRFLVNFSMYSFDTACLVFTLITGVVLPGEKTENIAAIALYIFTCAVTVAAEYTSKAARKRTFLSMIKTVFLNIFMFTKPHRYYTSFKMQRKRLNMLDEQTRNGQVITENGLVSLAKISAKEVMAAKREMYEIFLQTVPMALLQTYLLFESHQRFQLCNIKDLAKLGTILIPVIHGAQACSSYDAAKLDYEQSINFISFYQSNGDHPMAIFSNDMLSLGRPLNYLAHFTAILARFYTTLYFLPVSWSLSLGYLFLVFFVNWILFRWIPQHLLEVHENPPHGAPTGPSRFVDRWINIFCNVSTRYNFLSNKAYCKIFRLPFVLLQVLHFAIPLGLVFLVQFLITLIQGSTQEIHTPSTLNATLESCPHLEGIYTYSAFFKKMGDFLFSYYKSYDERFQAFQDMFQLVHLHWLLFYLQILATWVYAYYDLRKRLTVNDEYLFPTYPIVTGYAFYYIMISRVIETGDANTVRKMMILHTLKEDEFYGLVKNGWCSNKCAEISQTSLNAGRDKVLGRLGMQGDDAGWRINKCFEASHRFRTEFMRIRDILFDKETTKQQKDKDKLLFLAFFAYFDRKLVALSSDRIQKTFQIVFGTDAERDVFPWE